ncbi:unnamed protein product, partial [Adineta ricciae]
VLPDGLLKTGRPPRSVNISDDWVSPQGLLKTGRRLV